MAPPSQELEPPANPGRFSGDSRSADDPACNWRAKSDDDVSPRSKQGTSMIFGGLREIADAYKPDPTADNKQIDEAVTFLTSVRDGPAALGFLGRERPSD